MSRPPLIVLADDLTGAAEIAALAHDAGHRAAIFTRIPRGPIDAEVIVLSTDTRLLSPASAGRRVKTFALAIKKYPRAGFFKKTDSVLRGPVLAELEACATTLGFDRTLLVPANPSLGRVVRDGKYFIDDVPLHQTSFARDLHHPAATYCVRTLLGARKTSVVLCTPNRKQRPIRGITVGDAASAREIAHWAKTIDPSTLPAGGADFFHAWMDLRLTRHQRRARGTLPAGATLLLHGTTATPARSNALFFRGGRAPATEDVAAALRQAHVVVVSAPTSPLPDPKSRAVIARGFARLARRLYQESAFRHLVATGGATAATVLRELDWSAFTVVRCWGSGVVTLRPVSDPDFLFTVKPGSYPWPGSLRRAIPLLFPS